MCWRSAQENRSNTRKSLLDMNFLSSFGFDRMGCKVLPSALLLLLQARESLQLPQTGDGFMHFPVQAYKRASAPIDTPILNEFWAYAVNSEPMPALLYLGGVLTVAVSIGTPPQTTLVEVDTGSDELWVNADCKNAQPDFGQQELCEQNTRYDPSKSTSGTGPKGNSTIGYGSDGETPTGAEVDYYFDTISFGGNLALKGQQYGVASDTLGLAAGIMGLGPYLFGSLSANLSYPRVLDSLAAQGQIESRAFGLNLGSSDDATGSLIFGGYDRGRFSGPLATMPIVTAIGNLAR